MTTALCWACGVGRKAGERRRSKGGFPQAPRNPWRPGLATWRPRLWAWAGLSLEELEEVAVWGEEGYPVARGLGRRGFAVAAPQGTTSALPRLGAREVARRLRETP